MKTKIISKIKKNKTKVIIYFDDKTKIEVNPLVLTSFYLFPKKEIDSKTLKDIKNKSKEENLFSLAIKKLKCSNPTSRKMYEYLLKNGGTKKEINTVCDRLFKANLLSDENALDELLERADYKHYGYNKIVKKMYDMNLKPEVINKVKYNESRETREAKLYLDKNKLKYENKNNYQRKQCLYNSLISNGFSPSISEELVNKISNSNNKHEINVLKLDYLKTYSRLSRRYKGKELKLKIAENLVRKGYRYEDIKSVEELKK